MGSGAAGGSGVKDSVSEHLCCALSVSTPTIQSSERPVLWFPVRPGSQALEGREQSEDWNQGPGARSRYPSPLHVLRARGPVVVKVCCSEEPCLHLPGDSCSSISCCSYWGFGKISPEERPLFSFKSFANHRRESRTLGSARHPCGTGAGGVLAP